MQFSYNVNIHVNNKKQWRWFIETIYDFIIKFATTKVVWRAEKQSFYFGVLMWIMLRVH